MPPLGSSPTAALGLLCAALALVARHVSAAGVLPLRLPLETGGLLTVTRGRGEPPFAKGTRYLCQLGRKGQFSLRMPPKNYRATGVHATTPATVLDADTLACATGPVVTAGNTTVCIVPLAAAGAGGGAAAGARVRVHTTSYTSKVLCGANTTWAPAFVEHFPRFAPAFNRRPYFREAEGSVVAELDVASLAGQQVTLTVEIGQGLPTLLNHTFAVGPATGFVRIPFSLQGVASDVNADAVFTLASPTGRFPPARHTRKFSRSPPPPATTSVTTWQVDHEGKALLRDGVTFIMSGWFAGGYGHESAGLPPSHFIPRDGSGGNADLLAALGQASLTTQWGRDGVTFIRAGGWSNATLAGIFLDAAHAAGVSVLWNVGADTLAKSMAGVPNTKTNSTGNVTEEWGYTRGNVTMVKDHPAVAGYYACDGK